MVTWRGRRYGWVVFTSFTERSSAQVRASIDRAAEAGRRGDRARHARQRRRPAERGGRRRLDLRPRRDDRLDRRAQPPAPRLHRDGRGDQRASCRSSCSSTAAPPPPPRSSPARCRTATARLSSARTRTARASSRRSASCRTAARSTSRSASTSCRAGATSAAGASRRATGIAPDVRAQRRRRDTRRDEALDAGARRAGLAVRVAVTRWEQRERGGARAAPAPVGGRRARQARALPHRRAVLRPRAAADRRAATAARGPGDLVLLRTARAAARPARARPREGRTAASAGPTSRATCWRR